MLGMMKNWKKLKRNDFMEFHNDEYKALGIEVEDNVELINAANPNIRTIRNSIIPTQLCQVKYNTAYGDFGVFEDKTPEELKEDPRYVEWLSGGTPPEGESGEHFFKRSVVAFAKIVEEAMKKAAGGDFSQAKQVLSQLMNDPEVRRLLDAMGK